MVISYYSVRHCPKTYLDHGPFNPSLDAVFTIPHPKWPHTTICRTLRSLTACFTVVRQERSPSIIMLPKFLCTNISSGRRSRIVVSWKPLSEHPIQRICRVGCRRLGIKSAWTGVASIFMRGCLIVERERALIGRRPCTGLARRDTRCRAALRWCIIEVLNSSV